MNVILEDDIKELPNSVAERIKQADALLEGTDFWIVRKPQFVIDGREKEICESPAFRSWLESV